jgi:Spy/CpxP family protein refolding chaperone
MAALRQQRTVRFNVHNERDLTMSRPTARPMRLMFATLVLSAGGGLMLAAEAAQPPHGGMGGMGGMGGPMMMMGAPGHMDRMLEDVNATTDQRMQVKAIMDAAHRDLAAQHDAGRALGDQAMQLFTQATVDARQAEALRQQMQGQQDQASKRMLQAMLDVSRVLTPEQRQQLGQKMAQRRAMMTEHHGGGTASKPATQ